MKRMIIILMWILIILMPGCRKAADGLPVTAEDIYTGSEGLVMSFLDNAPPPQVFEKSYATVGLKLENKGAYDIVNGYLAISLEKDYMELLPSSLKSSSDYINFGDEEHIFFDLNGRSIESLAGEHDTITFSTKTGELEELSQTHTSTIAVTSCYVYRTHATATVCLDSDVYDIRKRVKSCTVGDLSLKNQGAPVAVTKIETKMLPKEDVVEPAFMITIENTGGGLIIDKGSTEDACYSEALDYDKLNKAIVNAYLIKRGDKVYLDCNVDKDKGKKAAEVRLKDNTGLVRCSYTEGITEEEGTFSTPLTVEIDYGYSSTISKQVEIKKIV